MSSLPAQTQKVVEFWDFAEAPPSVRDSIPNGESGDWIALVPQELLTQYLAGRFPGGQNTSGVICECTGADGSLILVGSFEASRTGAQTNARSYITSWRANIAQAKPL